jgi:RNA polymerase sigma-70 factor, ECF subfamily
MDDISAQLITDAAQGDREAFERIYRRYSSFVYTVALRITRNAEDAQEVTQDVFIRVHRGLRTFRFQSSFKTWVYRIAVNAALTAYRRASRHQKHRVEDEEIVEQVAVAPAQADAMDAGQVKARVEAMLETLPAEQKACLIMRELEGCTYDEIALSLGIPLNTVRTRILRARRALFEAAGKEARP